MAEWLADDAAQVARRFSKRMNHERMAAEDWGIELSQGQRARLRERAHALLEDPQDLRRMRTRRDRLPGNFEVALLIRQFLDREDQVALAEKVAGRLINQEWTADPAPDVVVMDVATLLGFYGIWNDLTEVTRQRAGEWIAWNLRSFPALFSHDSHFMGFLCRMHEAHPHVGLDEVDRLTLKLSHGGPGSTRRHCGGCCWPMTSRTCRDIRMRPSRPSWRWWMR